jgi:hypothetical protein
MRSLARLGPALALMLGACGGGGGDDGDRRAATPEARESPSAMESPAPERTPAARGTRTGPVTDAEEATIRGWADALRGGDVEAASRYFALPAGVSNGTPRIALRTQRAVRFFNESLPCGARLEATKRAERGFVVATFVLTERPGAGECGTGTGARARTAFLIRDRKIVEWLRVADPPGGGDLGSPS